jgi:predicted Rossmann fold nucleotide-binding protein DprA/Smf involved in DNA uptake
MASNPTSAHGRCLSILQEGPATTAEVAAETGFSLKMACTYLSNLHRRGKVARSPYNKPNAAGPGPRRVWLWEAA